VVENGTVRIIDLVFVKNDAAGNVSVAELEEFDREEAADFAALEEEEHGLFADDDVRSVAEAFEPDSSAALLLVEHVWVARVRDAVLDAGGYLLAYERIPRELVDAALEWEEVNLG
jgi:hypothetical protein